MLKKKKCDSKLDLMLKEGASNKKKTVAEMDKAITSTAHRLLREKIQFTKASGDLNISEQYKQSGFIILVPKDEVKAQERLNKTREQTRQPKVKTKEKIKQSIMKTKRSKQFKKKIKKNVS